MQVCSFVTSLIISSIPGVASSVLGPLPNDGGSDVAGCAGGHQNLLVILAHKTEFVCHLTF